MFRSIVLLAALLLTTGAAYARCASSHLGVWPPDGEMGVGAELVVTAYGLDRPVAERADKNVRLLAGKKTVPLTIQETFTQGYRTSQVMLKPRSALKAGQKYRLQVRREKAWKTVSTWTARATRVAAPVWNAAPKGAPISVTRLGCGPAIRANVTVDISAAPGPQAYLVEAVQGDQRSRGVVIAEGASVSIGHGMCSGPFVLQGDAQYAATIIPIDRNGQHGTAQKVQLN